MSTCGEDKEYRPHTTTQEMTAMTPPIERSDVTYYWAHNAEFRVEGKVYCVPIYPFMVGSQHFVEKYGLSPSDNVFFNAETVIELKGVTVDQFLVFLKFLFPTHQLTSEASTFTKDEWLTILTLSTLWHFHEARALAIGHLDGQLSELELICVGRATYICRWVLAGYKSIVQRPRSSVITPEEAHAIGHEVACQLWSVRYQHVVEGPAESEVESELLSKLGVEMRALGEAELDYRTKAEISREQREAEEKRKAEEELRMAAEAEAAELRLEEERQEKLLQEAVAEQERQAREMRKERERLEEEERKREEEMKRQGEMQSLRLRIQQLRLENSMSMEEKAAHEAALEAERILRMQMEEEQKRQLECEQLEQTLQKLEEEEAVQRAIEEARGQEMERQNQSFGGFGSLWGGKASSFSSSLFGAMPSSGIKRDTSTASSSSVPNDDVSVILGVSPRLTQCAEEEIFDETWGLPTKSKKKKKKAIKKSCGEESSPA